jgi:hypothetical protein
LCERLNEVPGVALDPSELEVRPSFALELLAEPASRERFQAAMEWAFAQADGISG